MAALLSALAALDRHSLSTKRPITVPLLRDWLQRDIDLERSSASTVKRLRSPDPENVNRAPSGGVNGGDTRGYRVANLSATKEPRMTKLLMALAASTFAVSAAAQTPASTPAPGAPRRQRPPHPLLEPQRPRPSANPEGRRRYREIGKPSRPGRSRAKKSKKKPKTQPAADAPTK